MRTIALDFGSHLLFDEQWLDAERASELFRSLRDVVPFRQEAITIMGRRVLQPRLTAWYGDPESFYTYSGLRNAPLPWTPLLLALKLDVEHAAGTAFNGALLNYYRDGGDSMGFHADAEPALGKDPIVASVSLGAPRRFVLRHRKDKTQRIALDLPNGSLLIMAGSTQHHYRHAVLKAACVEPRLNLTFRRVLAPPPARAGTSPVRVRA